MWATSSGKDSSRLNCKKFVSFVLTNGQHSGTAVLIRGSTPSKAQMPQGVMEEPAQSKPKPMYVKAFPLRSIDEIEKVKDEMHKNSIIILRITPLAQKNVDELRRAVEDLYTYVVSLGGDIARLGDERVILTPPGVKVWRGLL